MSKMKELGKPTTVGELREMLKDFSDEVGFGFRNQPMQSLLEVKYHDKAVYVVFQEVEKQNSCNLHHKMDDCTAFKFRGISACVGCAHEKTLKPC